MLPLKQFVENHLVKNQVLALNVNVGSTIGIIETNNYTTTKFKKTKIYIII